METLMDAAEEREIWDRLRRAEYDIGVQGERMRHMDETLNKMVTAVEKLQLKVGVIVGVIVLVGQFITPLFKSWLGNG